MKYNLDEADRERLTKFLDGCAHQWIRDGHVSRHLCTECGQTLCVRKEFLPKLRTFGTGNDMVELKNKIAQSGEAGKFFAFGYDKWLDTGLLTFFGNEKYANWLYTPDRYAWLVNEWRKENEKS